MGRPQLNRGFEIGAHAHADDGKPVAVGDLRQQREMRRGLFIGRRNAHHAGHRQIQLISAKRYKGIGLARCDTGLLRLLAGIDLHEARGPDAGGIHFAGQLAGQLFAVDGLDHIEHRQRLLDLVGLQRADQMQLDAVELLFQARPFGFGLLHPVFTEHPLAGLQHRADILRIEGFRYRHQHGFAIRAAGVFLRRRNPVANRFQPVRRAFRISVHSPVAFAAMRVCLHRPVLA